MKPFETLAIAAITSAAAFFPMATTAAEGIRIDHLGADNTLVRITGDSRYELLPVQEANDDARMHVVGDGQPGGAVCLRRS